MLFKSSLALAEPPWLHTADAATIGMSDRVRVLKSMGALRVVARATAEMAPPPTFLQQVRHRPPLDLVLLLCSVPVVGGEAVATTQRRHERHTKLAWPLQPRCSPDTAPHGHPALCSRHHTATWAPYNARRSCRARPRMRLSARAGAFWVVNQLPPRRTLALVPLRRLQFGQPSRWLRAGWDTVDSARRDRGYACSSRGSVRALICEPRRRWRGLYRRGDGGGHRRRQPQAAWEHMIAVQACTSDTDPGARCHGACVAHTKLGHRPFHQMGLQICGGAVAAAVRNDT